MKKITLKSISIRNFKGIHELDFTFSGSRNYISGENGTGKTTVFDAFTWLLFGKDSTDRKDFGIIPLTLDNDPIQVDSEISAVLDEDGAEITLKRIHHQKWVKRKGTIDVVYDGNETLFYYNGVPQKASEYKQKIEAIMDESIFKIITNPMYFNSLPWQSRREILTGMAGEVSTTDIASRLNGQSKHIIEVLSKGKEVEDYRREIAARKKKIKDDMTGIPTRIDELNKFMPEAVDEKAIQKQISEKQKAIEEIEELIEDANKKTDKDAQAYRSLRESLNSLKDQAEEIKRKRVKELSVANEAEEAEVFKFTSRINELDRMIEQKEREITFEKAGLQADQNSLQGLREQWTGVNAETLVFDENEFICPTCRRPHPAEDIETKKAEMVESFQLDKKARLEKIILQSTEIKGRVESAQKKIKVLEDLAHELKVERADKKTTLDDRPKLSVPDIEKDLSQNKEYQGILKSIDELNDKLSGPRQIEDISTHKVMKRTINDVISDLKKELTINESREKTKARITDLSEQEADLAQQLADLEKEEFAINLFIKARTDLIESRINDKFSMVRFSMFKTNINGSEEETCETLIKGVPFTDANNAARVNAGLDIINALSEHYGITAPIFIDNKESVNELIDCKSQLINLVVTKDEILTLT